MASLTTVQTSASISKDSEYTFLDKVDISSDVPTISSLAGLRYLWRRKRAAISIRKAQLRQDAPVDYVERVEPCYDASATEVSSGENTVTDSETKPEPAGPTPTSLDNLQTSHTEQVMETPAPSSHTEDGGTLEFIPCGKGLLEAIRQQPEERLKEQWKGVLRTSLLKRLEALHLGQNDLSVFKLCMVGPKPNRMRPTILVICSKHRRNDIESDFTRYLKAVDLELDLKVLADEDADDKGKGKRKWRVLLASQSYGISLQPGDRTGCPVELEQTLNAVSLVGRLARVRCNTEDTGGYYPACTIGGTIRLGDRYYALTIAHSMYQKAVFLDDTTNSENDHFSLPGFKKCALVDSYRWSGNEKVQLDSGIANGASPVSVAAMDWALFRLDDGFVLPNLCEMRHGNACSTTMPAGDEDCTIQDLKDGSTSASHQNQSNSSDSTQQASLALMVPETVSGYWRNDELPSEDVLVCAGRSGPQGGFLSRTPATLLYGQVAYEVYSLAFEYPLMDGDSGSWVIWSGKVCGYIFARVEGIPSAYMLPIEPVIEDIQTVYSTQGVAAKVNFPLPAIVDSPSQSARHESWNTDGDRYNTNGTALSKNLVNSSVLAPESTRNALPALQVDPLQPRRLREQGATCLAAPEKNDMVYPVVPISARSTATKYRNHLNARRDLADDTPAMDEFINIRERADRSHHQLTSEKKNCDTGGWKQFRLRLKCLCKRSPLAPTVECALLLACLAVCSLSIWLIVTKTKIPAYAKGLASSAVFGVTAIFIPVLLLTRRRTYIRSSRDRLDSSTIKNMYWVTNWLRSTPTGKVPGASEGSTTLWSQAGKGPDPKTGDNNLVEIPIELSAIEPVGMELV